MRIEFKHRFTDAVLHTEEVPDDVPNVLRLALELAAIRGRPADALCDLRDETESDLEDEGIEDSERKLLRRRIEAIARELASPSSRAYLDGANLARAYLAGANLAGAYLDRAYLDGANLAGAYLDGAYLDGAYLDGAYLARAYLAGANLARAYLDGANLDGANLAGANLAGAYLDRAYLDGANLDGANLAGANLARAYLAGANLDGANLAGANLAGANLDGAYLARAYLANARNPPAGVAAVDPPEPYQLPPQTVAAQAERARRYREAHPEVPVVESLDARILEAVTTGGGTLYMRDWHSDGECGTTHCRAGWAIHLAGNAGYELERKLGSAERAGAQIYMASVGFAPWFYDPSDENALEDIRRCAAEQAAAEDEAAAALIARDQARLDARRARLAARTAKRAVGAALGKRGKP